MFVSTTDMCVYIRLLIRPFYRLLTISLLAFVNYWFIAHGIIMSSNVCCLHDTHTRTYVRTYKQVLKRTSRLLCIAKNCIVVETFGSIPNSWQVKVIDEHTNVTVHRQA